MIPEILVVIVWAYILGRFLLMKRDPNAAGVSSTEIFYTNCLYLERVCEVKRWEINDCGGKTEKKKLPSIHLNSYLSIARIWTQKIADRINSEGLD